MVCSAFHSTKAVVSQVGTLQMGLQTVGIDCKGYASMPTTLGR